MKKSILFVILFSFTSSCFSQIINSDKLDSFFNLLNKNEKAMGSIAISKNGKLLYSNSIGYIDEALTLKSNSNTQYRIGSITKMFTATMIFNLIEKNKLKLNTTLSTYFPNIPNANSITISNLLNHRSGIFNITNDSSYFNWCSNIISQEEMITKIASYKSIFEPNIKTDYSNSNYILLTYIIEKITKQSFSTALDKMIIQKLKLTNTKYGDKINTNLNQAHSFNFNGNNWSKFEIETDVSVPLGAGAIISTPTDLTIFITALFNEKLVSKQSLLQMQTITDGLGMGMFSFPFYTHKAFGHTGGIDGFRSNLAYFEKDSIAIAYCSNAVNYPVNDIIIAVLSIYFNRDFSLPNFAEKQTTISNLLKYIGTYSSSSFPLKIDIKISENKLTAQATGQSPFPLEYVEMEIFKFEAAGIKLIFNSEKNEMTLHQGGRSFVLNKEK